MAELNHGCKCHEDSENLTMANLKHYYLKIAANEEIWYALEFIRVLEFRQMIIFVRNRARCRVLCEVLNEQGCSSMCLHGYLAPGLCLKRYLSFHNMQGPCNILVATPDSIGHAMSFQGVDVAINFDEVATSLDYMHRISTGEMRKGLVINFIRANEQKDVFKQIDKQHNVNIECFLNLKELRVSDYMDK